MLKKFMDDTYGKEMSALSNEELMTYPQKFEEFSKAKLLDKPELLLNQAYAYKEVCQRLWGQSLSYKELLSVIYCFFRGKSVDTLQNTDSLYMQLGFFLYLQLFHRRRVHLLLQTDTDLRELVYHVGELLAWFGYTVEKSEVEDRPAFYAYSDSSKEDVYLELPYKLSDYQSQKESKLQIAPYTFPSSQKKEVTRSKQTNTRQSKETENMDYSDLKVYYYQEKKGFFQKGTPLTLTLGKLLGQGGYGQVYETEFPDLVAKLSLTKEALTPDYITHLKKLIDLGQEFQKIGLENFTFPKQLICDEAGHIIGFTMKKCTADNLLSYTTRATECLSRKDMVAFALKIAVYTRFLHNNGFLIGDISFKNLLFDYEKKEFYFIDVDSFILESKPDTAFTPPFFVPEALEKVGESQYKVKKDFIKSRKTEFYGLTVLLYYILMRAEPYGSGELEDIYENKVHLKNWTPQQIKNPNHRKWWILPDYIRELFVATLSNGGRYYQLNNRPSLDVWVEALKRYEAELPDLIKKDSQYGELTPQYVPELSQVPAPEDKTLQTVTDYPYGDGVYSGTVKDGKPHGRGKCTLPYGSVYEGEFVNGKIQGIGKMSGKGYDYEGNFLNGRYSGHGKLSHSTGHIYEGDFVDGLAEGVCKRIWPDGSVYEGEWKAHKRHGKGIYVKSDRQHYAQTYSNDKLLDSRLLGSADFSKLCPCGSGKMYKNCHIRKGKTIYRYR